ncbi:MAG: hypothetical protein ACK4ND_13710 [Cytophagaceae bacterium]
MKKSKLPLREQIQKRLFAQSDTPIIIYLVVLLGIGFSLFLRRYHEDLSLNLVSEILGAAFTLFIIDVMLVKTKTKRWRVVQKHVDYLIARNVNRIRDGISTRVFSFHPSLKIEYAEDDIPNQIRIQREALLNDLEDLDTEQLASKINLDLFSDDNYEYFNEKADDIWSIINMKYSEYLAPQLVHLLIELHTNLKDVCAQIRIYNKSNRYTNEKEYYHKTGLKGAAGHLKEIIRISIILKKQGYSEPAKKM